MFNFAPGLWGILKMRIARGRGQVHHNLQTFLHEFSYRHLYETGGHIFQCLLKHLEVKTA